MSLAPLDRPTELMADHLITLQGYAKRVLVQQNVLDPSQEVDKSLRLGELMALATSFKCTEKEVVGLLYKSLFK